MPIDDVIHLNKNIPIELMREKEIYFSMYDSI
jgi:hypothetical protein